jgi:chaperonin GroEL (HSP60 family)
LNNDSKSEALIIKVLTEDPSLHRESQYTPFIGIKGVTGKIVDMKKLGILDT